MEAFNIYIDRLKTKEQKVDFAAHPDFLDVHEPDLAFPEEVKVQGDIYLADDHLIAHLQVQTKVCIPCSICNELLALPVIIKDLYLSEPLADIKTAIWDLAGPLRESILLQAPLFAECNDGNCPERAVLESFLAKPE